MPYKDKEKGRQRAKENYWKNREKRILQVKRYYKKNWAKRNKQKKQWAKKNKEKLREYRKNYYKRYYQTEKGKAILKKSGKKWLESNKFKRLCHYAVRNAIRRSELIKPKRCTQCNRKIRMLGHHPNYTKPLDVLWVCHDCHMAFHHLNFTRKPE